MSKHIIETSWRTRAKSRDPATAAKMRIIIASQSDRQLKRFFLTMLALVCIGYTLLWFAILSKWEPGNQEAIYQAYKAQRHEAESFVVPATGEIATK